MTVAWCSRCRCPAPIDESELTGDSGGDPSLLPVIVPPDGWIGDPDDADGGIICGGCANPEEIVQWMADLATVQHATEDHDAPVLRSPATLPAYQDAARTMRPDSSKWQTQ